MLGVVKIQSAKCVCVFAAAAMSASLTFCGSTGTEHICRPHLFCCAFCILVLLSGKQARTRVHKDMRGYEIDERNVLVLG